MCIRDRLAAFGLALLMGLSPLGNLADVHAAESEISQNAVTEKESKTESDHPVSEISEQTVTAEDITKDVSDKEFMAETCMEGIQYDPEKEDVTLERIEAEDGSAYHPDQAGTYVATYWVVPKDERDSYSITRKIILTDKMCIRDREKQRFKEYLFRKEQPVRFFYEGERYEIQIEDVKLFPQGYSALALYPEYLKDEPSVLLVDIGGWTVDLMRLDNAVPNAATCRSLELGVIRCMDEILEQVRRNTGLSITETQVCLLYTSSK